MVPWTHDKTKRIAQVIVDGDGFAPLIWAAFGLVIGSLTGAAIIGAVCAASGRRDLGCTSLLMSWVLLVGLGVCAVVLWRVKDGEATLYDGLWAIGLGALGRLAARALWTPRPPPARQNVP